ncbi:MAG: hypothetical protein HUJ59_01195, partial [Bacilli bacterium]|nr:hypothetical protein [Bacilli bacterium]
KKILNITDDVKEEIMNGKSSIEIRKAALSNRYKPMIVDGINKVIKGITTLEELNNKLVFF